MSDNTPNLAPVASVVWGAAGAELQADEWRKLLVETNGNITDAGAKLKRSKRYAMVLTRRHDLNKFAAELRKAKTGRTHGRPPVDATNVGANGKRR